LLLLILTEQYKQTVGGWPPR